MPDLDAALAVFGSVFIPLSYVLSLYALVPRQSRALPRDHPQHVCARFGAVLGACILAPLPLAIALYSRDPALPLLPRLLRALGAHAACVTLSSTLFAPAVLFLAVFAGPLIALVVDVLLGASTERGKETLWVAPWRAPFRAPSLPAVRAFLVAPLSEEWAFRACVSSLWALVHARHALTLACTAGAFAAAHAHHYFDHRRRGASRGIAASRVLGQLAYTGAFGALAAHVFLKTGSVWGVAGLHAAANAMGLPRCEWAEAGHPAFRARHALFAAHAGGLVAAAALLGSGAWLTSGGTGASYPCALA